MPRSHDPFAVSRRAALRGLGATISLPFLESLASVANAESILGKDAAAAAKGLTGPPRRWAMMMFANGVNPEDWWAKGEGAQMELSRTLEPLAPFREELLFVDNLTVFNSTSPGHHKMFTNFLSGFEVEGSPVPDGAESLDYYMARKIGARTTLPVLNLGCESAEYSGGGGVPSIYWGTMSWSSDKTPVAPEIYPRRAFDRLFGKARLREDQSVLDAVLEQSNRLNRRLSTGDRAKLDEFMTHIRAVEQRIEMAGKQGTLEGWRPSLSEPNIDRPGADLPQDVRNHMQLMIDLMVLALRMDKTRIATLLLNRDTSKMTFNFLEGVGNAPMHGISHHANDAGAKERYQKVNRYHVERCAYALEQMRAIDEGDGSTLLDNTMLLFGSNMMDGHIHDGRQLPLVICGGRNCDIRPGRVLRYDGDETRKLCNLHLSFLHRMGVNDERFGDSTGPLQGLDA